jgi:uncharacterized membrane protein YGL010W
MNKHKKDTLKYFWAAYRDYHKHPLNIVCHLIGIPIIICSINYLLMGIGILFLIVGHRVFEKNNPALFDLLKKILIEK